MEGGRLAVGVAGRVEDAGVRIEKRRAETCIAVFLADATGSAKGAVLFDGSGGRNYMVHASRREGPGMVEVHTKDTDILYVLRGSATVVTGGTMVEGKNIAADEIRGKEINGGEARKLVPGDAMIIPNGVPHWFKEVDAPFLYYVVKVR